VKELELHVNKSSGLSKIISKKLGFPGESPDFYILLHVAHMKELQSYGYSGHSLVT
jgi:hypothetical protein